MKSFTLLFLSLTLMSSFSYAYKVGVYKVKACSLIIPRDTPENVFTALMDKGYNPMNTIGDNSHIEIDTANGSAERKIAPHILQNREWAGIPYLELKSEVNKVGDKATMAAVGVVGIKQMQKYSSYKTVTAQESNASLFSLDLIPNCTGDN